MDPDRICRFYQQEALGELRVVVALETFGYTEPAAVDMPHPVLITV